MPRWEFLEDAEESGVEDEALPADDRHRPRRWLKVALAGLAAAAVVTALVVRTGAEESVSAPSASDPSPSATAAPPTTRSHLTVPSPADIVLGIVTLTAMHDYVRPDGNPHNCPDVRPGSVPQRRAASVLRRNLDGFRVTDTARVLNEWAELCMLVLRANNGHGTILALRIIPPRPGEHRDPGFDAVQTGFAPELGGSVQYADSVTRNGWAVTVGSFGPVRDSPAASALVRIVQDERLRW